MDEASRGDAQSVCTRRKTHGLFLVQEAAMSVQLLDKTRKIGKLLHNNNSRKVVFNDICIILTDILDSNVLVISRKGKRSRKLLASVISVISSEARVVLWSLPSMRT